MSLRATECIGGAEIRQDGPRVVVAFPAEPTGTARALLQRYGFRQSPAGWTRLVDDASWYAAQEVARLVASARTPA